MLRLTLDIEGLKDLLELPGRARQAMNDAARDLTAMAHARALELASQRLHVRRKMYVDALSIHQVNDSTWFLQLEAKSVWIEDGMTPHNMIDDLLKGRRSRVIPFRHGPAQLATPPQQDIINAVRTAMKKRGVPWGKIERDEHGQPRFGRLHSFSVMHAPLKTGDGPSQGHGTVGDVRQGPNDRQRVGGGPAGGGRPFLQGVSVYQRPKGGGSVERDVVTFRTVSESQRGQMIWNHPGLQPAGIFDSVHDWLTTTWEKDIAPMVMAQIKG